MYVFFLFLYSTNDYLYRLCITYSLNSGAHKWCRIYSLKRPAATRFDIIRGLVHTYVTSFERLGIVSILNGWEDIPELSFSVDCIVVCKIVSSSLTFTQDHMMLQIHEKSLGRR